MNTRFTNPSVDKGLTELARVLVAAVRGKGKAYRHGGDEFALLLVNAMRGEAAALAERIRSAVAALKIPGEPEMQLTVSIGAACLGDLEEKGAGALQKAAAEAYLLAKRNGKNRVECWTPTIR